MIRRLAAVAIAAFLAGTLTGPMLAGTALAPITLQPGQSVTIIAADLPTPTPTPTPTPIPTPTPPSARPFPAPVTTRTVTVPSSIDATGSTDVSGALSAFVAIVPDGSIIAFPATAIYRIDHGIQFAGRHNLIFEGNGATLRTGSGAGNTNLDSTFVLGHAYGGYWAGNISDIAIRGFVFIGRDATPGTFEAAYEHQAAIEVEGGTRVEITGNRSTASSGDFVKVGDASAFVWVHHNTVPTVGRNAATIISGTDVTIEANTFGISGYCVFDVEPNVASETTRRATFRGNTAVSWGNAWLAVEGSHTGATIDGVTVSGNTVSNGSLLTVIDNGGTSRMRNIAVTGNTGGKAAAGPVLRFAHIDGLTVTGNVQPLTSGVLASITDSTNVVYAP